MEGWYARTAHSLTAASVSPLSAWGASKPRLLRRLHRHPDVRVCTSPRLRAFLKTANLFLQRLLLNNRRLHISASHRQTARRSVSSHTCDGANLTPGPHLSLDHRVDPPPAPQPTSVKPPLFRKRAARCMSGACVPEAGTGCLCSEAGGPAQRGLCWARCSLQRRPRPQDNSPSEEERLRDVGTFMLSTPWQVCGEGSAAEDPLRGLSSPE